MNVVLGPKSRCIRAPWYDITHPLKSLFSLRSKVQHDERRKVWDQAFGARALHNYEACIEDYVQQFEHTIITSKTKPINISKVSKYYSLDVICNLAFGCSFDLLKSGKSHHALDLFEDGQSDLAVLGPLPWLFMIVTRLPIISAGYHKWLKWCQDRVLLRQQVSTYDPSYRVRDT